MKKITLIATLVMTALLTPLAANAQFGALLGGGTKTDSKTAAPDPEVFLKTAAEADGLVRKSADTLFLAVATKDQIDAQADTLKAANAITNAGEKEAAVKKAQDDQQAQLAKVDWSAKSTEIGKTMDAKKKEQIGASIYNFVLGMLKDKELVSQGQGLISSLSSNPMALGKLGKVKDVMSSLTGQMGNIGTIASGIQKLSSVVGLKALPASASDKPQANAD